MKLKHWKKLIIGCMVLVLLILWGVRVYSLNDYYWKKDSIEVLHYPPGQYVEFGNNYFRGNYIDGYSIKVDSYKIEDIDEFLGTYNKSRDDYEEDMPERVCQVEVTIRNEDSEAPGIALSDISLCGIDYYSTFNFELFGLANPDLGMNMNIYLDPHSEYTVRLVFPLWRERFTRNNWNNMDKLNMMLLLTSFPQMQYIVLHE